MQVLILSPHCDDIPLSLGGTLISRYLGDNIEVIVVFSKSAYTINNKGNANIALTSKIRNEEEKQAAEKLGYNVTFWNYGEPLVRPGFQHIDYICRSSRETKENQI